MDESAMRLTARVAPYIEAIKQKRAAGWRWKDIKLALGFACSDHALAQAVRRCKWVAEQRALLEPAARSAPTVAKTTTVPQARPAIRSLPPGASQDSADLSDLQSKGVKIYP